MHKKLAHLIQVDMTVTHLLALKLLKKQLKGASKNSNFCVRARKHRAQNRSVYAIHEASSTELTPLSRKKCIFRGALKP